MTFIDISAIDDQLIISEFLRRKSLRERGQCTFCERQIDSEPTCQYPRRHFSSTEKANQYPSPRSIMGELDAY
jgi:hypothetical protein